MELTQVKQLKLNVSNINSFLKKSNKNYNDIKKSNQRIVSRQVEQDKLKSKEKSVEKKPTISSPLKTVKDVAKSSMGLFDKILNFGGLLLSGILLNALPSIKEKIDKFKEDNKEIIDNVVSTLTVVKDFAVDLFNSFTGPYAEEGSLDWLAKFDDSGNLQSGILKEVEKAFDGLGGMINAVDKFLGGEGKIGNALITGEKILQIRGGRTGVFNRTTGEFTERAFTEDEKRRYKSGDFSVNNRTTNTTVTSSAVQNQGSSLNYGLVNPTPNTDILKNKGGYAADTGLDIIGKVGDPIVSPVDGVLEYAERGHTAQMGQDSDPTKPGVQDQLSFRIRLNKPFIFEGKKVNFVYGTHLSTLDAAVANKFDIPIKAGQKLGTMGVANNVPHLHIGFVEDRLQTGFLNFKEVRRLLSGQSSNGEKKGGAGLLKGVKKDERNVKNIHSSSSSSAQISRPSNNNNRLASLNSSMGEDGSTTFIYAVQPVIT